MTATTATRVDFDVLRNSRFPDARAAREQADWLSWLELGGIRPATLADYSWATDRLLEAFPSKTLSEFTDGDIAIVLKRFPQQSRKTRSYAFASWFRWGVKTRRIDRNPMDLLPEMPKRKRRPIEVFSPAEVQSLLNLPQPDGPLMAILLDAGLRKGEARRLKAKNCDMTSGRIAVLNGKGGHDRLVPMTPRLKHVLGGFFRFSEIKPNDYLWYTRPGGHHVKRTTEIVDYSFHYWWTRCLDAAGVLYRNPHTTRHTYGRTMRRAGLPIEELQLNMGHSSIQVTVDFYGHVEVEDVERTFERIFAG